MGLASKINRSPTARFFIGQFGALAAVLALSDSRPFLLLYTTALVAVAVSVLTGAVKAAPRRNALAALPALCAAAGWIYLRWLEGEKSIPLGLFVIITIVGASFLFIILERNNPRRGV